MNTPVYKSFDPHGAASVPTLPEVRGFAERGILTALVLDANVCLDLATLESGATSRERLESLRSVLMSIALSGADVIPGYGIYELSTSPRDWTVDRSKLDSLTAAVSRVLGLATETLSSTRSFKRWLKSTPYGSPNSERRAASTKRDTNGGPRETEPFFEEFRPLLKLLYACSLKMRLLARDGLSHQTAMRSLTSYCHWLSDELNVLAILPLQAAFAVFGGDSNARKLLRIDSKIDERTAAWSSAWDIFHVQMLHHMSIHPVLSDRCRPIFITRDGACNKIFSRTRLRGAVLGLTPGNVNLVEIDYDYPHLEALRPRLDVLLRDTALQRLSHLTDGPKADVDHLDHVIATLESAM